MRHEEDRAGNAALVPNRNSSGGMDSKMDTKGCPRALREQRRTGELKMLKMLKMPVGKIKNKGGNYLQVSVTIKVLPYLRRASSAQKHLW